MTTVVTRRVNIPAEVPRVALVVRIIDGIPVIFTDDGKFVSKCRNVDVHSHLDAAQSATIDVLLGKIEYGLPERASEVPR